MFSITPYENTFFVSNVYFIKLFDKKDGVVLGIFEKYILGVAVPLGLIGLGIFFLFYLNFFFIKKPKKVFSGLFGKNKGSGISSFSALTVALAGTLGVGNIVGVSGAIIMGGPGAVFWMIVSAFAAMVLKYSEILLAHNHRRRGENGYVGGAMYYIEDRLGGKLGRLVGVIFSFFCILNALSMGCMLQANAVSSSFVEISSVSPFFIAFILALVCGTVILCGVHDISPLTSVIIPTMTILYVAISLVVITAFRNNLLFAFELIIKDAFRFDSVGGGLFGFFTSQSIRYGTMRGILSNEAGCGTAPMAHASSRAKNGAEQGVWGIVEVFVDTILLCTLTAFSILCVYGEGVSDFVSGEEMKLVLSSFGAALGNAAAPVISVMVFFFAFATIICWAYYGICTVEYITKRKSAQKTFQFVYILCVFMGALNVGDLVWQLSDVAIASMTLINLLFLYLMRKEIKVETKKLKK